MSKERKIRFAINGAGRIGRAIFRSFYENKHKYDNIELVAINDPHEAETLSHLLRYDSVHGRFKESVVLKDGYLVLGKDRIFLSHTRQLNELPWEDLDVDVVLECTGRIKSYKLLQGHIDAGAKKVVLSAPGEEDVKTTIVLGANEDNVNWQDNIISIGSCSTNALAPVLKIIDKEYGIDSGFMTTVHAYTSDQRLLDSHHKDLRRARAAGCSIIPTKTGAARTVGKVLPQLEGKMQGYALRVPTANVSVLDLSLSLQRVPDKDFVSECFINAAKEDVKNILSVESEPLVSCDFNHNRSSAIVDLTQMYVSANLLKLVVWYDNEWGFANRMLDIASMCFEKSLDKDM